MAGPGKLGDAPRLDGLWSVTGHPAIVDAAAATRPDFIVLDTQHGVALSSLDASVFTVMAHYDVPGLVRVEAVDPVPIGRALDLGAAGVIVPQVDDVSEAELAVAATRYMPGGRRSFGMQTRRVGAFEGTPYVVIQIETGAALAEAEKIAAVDGVDCLYIGPADLGLSLRGSTAEVGAVYDARADDAEMGDAFERVIAACRAGGVAPGVHCLSGAAAAAAHQAGFTVTAVAVDINLIMDGLAAELSAARGFGPSGRTASRGESG
ncbi:MAG: aldolase/citrate lyase family protein [Actinobacteria bacterium]|nr:aldolase/citrate lyase family protein [Actinomycetota bacterium]